MVLSRVTFIRVCGGMVGGFCPRWLGVVVEDFIERVLTFVGVGVRVLPR